jgi:hypothetical protein
MIYLIIGILGIAVFKKDTVVELFEIGAAHVWNAMDKAWTAIFG